MSIIKPPLALSCAMLVLAGCVTNPYRITYSTAISNKAPMGEPSSLQMSTGQPAQLLTSTDLRADAIKMLEKGYKPMGHSKFRGQFVDARLALQQATDVGADVVMVMQKYVSTDTSSVAVTDWTPDRRVVVRERSQAAGPNTNASQDFTRESLTIIEGEYQTHYVPLTVETYDQSALYWQKVQAPILGVLGSDLEDADRTAQQSNKGILVRAVVNNSPAFLADVFRGDIIRKLGDHEVLGPNDFFEQVQVLAGKTTELEIWRKGQIITKSIELGLR
jgi:hypothetical protein